MRWPTKEAGTLTRRHYDLALEAAALAYAAEHNVTTAKGMQEVLKTDTGRKLYEGYTWCDFIRKYE